MWNYGVQIYPICQIDKRDRPDRNDKGREIREQHRDLLEGEVKDIHLGCRSIHHDRNNKDG